ncbi:MAG: hypothetical protein JWQ44_2958 [Chthoniobacter sp.]|nr:hypothetical protein [Chthoniobacter sp.]
MKTLFLILMHILPECQTEDAAFCHWDASTMGNGRGTSFVAISETMAIDEHGDLLSYE